jgi:hypothetical protein
MELEETFSLAIVPPYLLQAYAHQALLSHSPIFYVTISFVIFLQENVFH